MKNIFQYEPNFSDADKDAVNSYLQSGGWCAEFGITEKFELELAKIARVEHAVVMNSGTSCLAASLMAVGVGAGDEVIVPNLTMAGTASAVILAGAKPVFVDVEADQLTLDSALVRKSISKKTKAIVHVSLNGRGGSVLDVQALCAEHDIPLIEDAAQSMGSMFKGKPLGGVGTIGVYSFSSPKIVTTGQGGVALTNNKKLATNLRRIKNFGRESGGADNYEFLGYNFKFTDLQAALGLSQLATFEQKIKLKKKIYSTYQMCLADISQIKFLSTDCSEVTPWFVDVFVDGRNELFDFLAKRGIGTRKIYPPLHSQNAFKSEGAFKVAQEFSSNGLWLPSSFNVLDNVDFICENIREFYR